MPKNISLYQSILITIGEVTYYILISSRLKLDMNDKISEGITKIIEYIMSKAVKKKMH